jgi:alkylated DNA repair dioxygenase AlkB
MVNDLFSDPNQLEPISMCDADVAYLQQMPLPASPTDILTRLINETTWRSESISLYGRTVLQPRLIAWYGDPGQHYAYSGIQLAPEVWTPLLLEIKKTVESIVGADFNSVLLNYYRNQRDSIGMHSDDEPELGKEPIIASVSLGDPRTFVLRHKANSDLKPIQIPLESGSLLVMRGATQKYWKHGINKSVQACGPRVNLTFRRIIPRI